MLTVHSFMLVSLGFLLAVLLGFVVAPAYWARAVRLTTERIRRSMPMTEAEIRAEKDRLRAEHAVRVHRLEAKADRAKLSAARQRVEINRRDAIISGLERQVKELDTGVEASENARQVLEQTIIDRLPKLEARVLESRKLLRERDQELEALKTDTSKTFRALDEAMQINAQQRAEIDRMRSAIAARGARSTEGAASPRFDAEVALRSEVEALRARTRDQASLISRLQEMLSARGDAIVSATSTTEPAASSEQPVEKPSETPPPKPEEISAADAKAASLAAEVTTLKEANRTQGAEIERLKASLKVFEEGANSQTSLRDNRIALKARLSANEKEISQHVETIKRLRTELATSNERLAKQAAHFMDEMRRLGAGTMPTSVPSRRNGERSGRPERRPSLAQRITERVPETASAMAAAPKRTVEPEIAKLQPDSKPPLREAKSPTGGTPDA
ncbi:MAG: hypothetical protein KDJ36_10250, partial [Hyphomicrobiaceae bacterium]|nr:hypothetical protein [Hyphomicrobiaceae bacterium]